MKLIVGLGNPGKEYENTRHNCGFLVIDKFADQLSVDIKKEDFKGIYGKFKYDDEHIILFKPLTYMNLSGIAVQEIVHFFKIKIEDIVIIFDDMAVKPGEIRLRLGGSSGGQRGMQNIIENLGTDNIKRIRIGIGEPIHGGVDHVLGKATGEEEILINNGIDQAVNALKKYLKRNFDCAMNDYNGGGRH